MEVICSSCGTEYDFDEARVPTDGVTVKCTTCGHIFKVTKQGAVANVNTSAASKKKGANWQIKKQNGDHLSFKALSTLQKWIVERKVSAEDEISRTGDKWTKLADVPEFQVFFQALEPAPPPGNEAPSEEALPADRTEEAPDTEVQNSSQETEVETEATEKAPKPDKKPTANSKKKTRGVAKRGTVKKKKKNSTKKKSTKKNITLEAFMQESESDGEVEEAPPEDALANDAPKQDSAFLEDEDPIQLWQAQKQKRMTMIGVGISSFMVFLLLISVIHSSLPPSLHQKISATSNNKRSTGGAYSHTSRGFIV